MLKKIFLRALPPACVALAALGARLAPFAEVLRGGRVNFFEFDPYFHMYRAFRAAENGLALTVPRFDFFTNFPQEAPIFWPQGFDRILGLVINAVYFLGGGRYEAEAACALVPPVIGALNVLLIYLLAGKLYGSRAALVAGLLAATFPALAGVEVAGRVDHHCVEALLATAGFFAIINCFKPGRASVADHAVCGLLVALPYFFVPTGPVFTSCVLACAAAVLAARRRHLHPRDALLLSFAFFLGSLLLYSFAALRGAAGEEQQDLPRLFMKFPAFCGFLIFLSIATSYLIYKRTAAALFKAAVLLLAVAVFAGLLAYSAKGQISDLVSGLSFIGRAHSVVSTLDESTPLFSHGIGRALFLFGPFVFLAPVFAWLVLRQARSEGRTRRPDVALCAWLAFGLALCLLQQRFATIAGPAVAIVSAAGIVPAFRLFSAGVVRAAIAAGLALSFLPTVLLMLKAGDPYAAEREALRPALEFLRDSPPPVSNGPGAQPSYGVLAYWGYGHWITYISGKPVTSSPFSGKPWHDEALRRSAGLILEQDDRRAVETIDGMKIGYVLAAPLTDRRKADLAALAGVPVPAGTLFDRLVKGKLADSFAPVFSSPGSDGHPLVFVFERRK